MKRTVEVWLGEAAAHVGWLHHERQGARESAAFEYHPGWLADAEGFALAPGLPRVRGMQFQAKTGRGEVFPAVFADTGPDGWGRRLIQRDHAKRRQEERRTGAGIEGAPLDALDYLLAVDDVSRVGAIRLRDADGRFQRAPEPGRRATPPLIELGQLIAASCAVETHTETAADLAYLRGRGTSLGGLRPKCSVIDDDGALAIGKFPSVGDERAVTKGEVLAMRLARRAGVDAAPARLVDSDGTPVALIRRFDRAPDGGRRPYASAATLLGLDAGDAGEHAYTEIVDAIRRHGAEPDADIAQLWRRIAFSILITNVDDHLHNHGFLHLERGLWRLSPAFDLNPCPERARELKTWISEDTGPEASIEAMMSVRAYFKLSAASAAAVLGEVETAVATWRAQGRAIGMTAGELDAFAEAFEHRERDAARRLAAG